MSLDARIPRSLRTRVQTYCVEHWQKVRDFITEALHESLRRRRYRT